MSGGAFCRKHCKTPTSSRSEYFWRMSEVAPGSCDKNVTFKAMEGVAFQKLQSANVAIFQEADTRDLQVKDLGELNSPPR